MPAKAYDAELRWAPVSGAAGYRVYARAEGQSFGAGIDVGLPGVSGDGRVHAPVSGLTAGIAHYFAVSAYAADASESGLSNELSLLVMPTATASPPATRTATFTATRTPVPTGSATATRTGTPTRSATATASSTATSTPPPTHTMSATRSATASATRSATHTHTATAPPSHTQTLTPTPTATAAPDWSVSLDSVHVMAGGSVDMPVSIAEKSGIRAFALGFAFDPSVVEFERARLLPRAGAGSVAPTSQAAGQLTLVGVLAEPLHIGGAMLEITFNAVGACGAATDLAITSCLLDGGAIGCQPFDGDVTVRCGVGGRIRHWRTDEPVDSVSVTMLGDAGAEMATTDDLGLFTFGEMDSGLWEMQPSKRGAMQGAVSALDGALVLRAAAGAGDLDAVQRLACDVTGNGQVTALDASRILQLAVGQVTQLPIAGLCGSDWAFVPEPSALPHQRLIQPESDVNTCQPGGIVLDPLIGDAPQQDFVAVLFGDCSGNWSAAPRGAASLRLTRGARARLGTPRRGGGTQWTVPLFVDSPEPFLSVAARVAVQAGSRPVAVRGTAATADALLRSERGDDGILSLAIASGAPLSGADGPVAMLVFESEQRRPARLARLLSAEIDEVPIVP